MGNEVNCGYVLYSEKGKCFFKRIVLGEVVTSLSMGEAFRFARIGDAMRLVADNIGNCPKIKDFKAFRA